MRCCVTALVGLVLCLVVGLWLVLPPVAGFVLVSGLKASGVACDSIAVDVGANPPFELLTGHADSVHLTCENGHFQNVQAGSVDLTATDVGIFDRRFGNLHGSLGQVVFTGTDGTTVTSPEVAFDGPPTNAEAEFTMPSAEAISLAEARLRAATGVAAVVTMKAPDAVTIAASGRTGGGRLAIVNGTLVLQPAIAGLPTVTLVSRDELGAANVFRLTGVTIAADGVHLTATVDVASLLGLPS